MSAVDVASDPFIKKQRRDTWSAWFRKRRFALIEAQIERIAAAKGSCRIIDIGGRPEYWGPALPTLERCMATVTIVNLERTVPDDHGVFEFRFGDACDLSAFADASFDLAHSNSLLEHLGTWENMTRCAAEICRVSRSYYVQTPNFWFPYEPHFRVPLFHWLPEQLRARIVMRFALGYFNRANSFGKAMTNVDSVRLLDKAQIQALLPDAHISFEKFAGLRKSLIAVREAD